MPSFDHPAAHIAEITLIGTGGGYGESCVIHIGEGKWIIVDSCRNPHNKEVLPISYLDKVGVNLDNVELIVCTHWHDDHIQGLSEILLRCPKAQFAMARANDLKKFLELVSLDSQKISREPSNASTTEFMACLNLLKSRKQQPIWANQDRILHAINGTTQVISLSPSDLTMTRFDQEISSLITEYGSATAKIQVSSPNAKSVAIFLKLGKHRAILGADLEVSTDPLEGWANIVNSSKSLDEPASLVKIPHHGSENAYYLELWLNHIKRDNPIAKLTPWNKNKGLPQKAMLEKYLTHTEMLYMTSDTNPSKPKKRVKSVDKLLGQFNPTIQEVRFAQGYIRSRIDKSDINIGWEVTCFDSAYKVT